MQQPDGVYSVYTTPRASTANAARPVTMATHVTRTVKVCGILGISVHLVFGDGMLIICIQKNCGTFLCNLIKKLI